MRRLYEAVLASDPELVEAAAGLIPEELIDVPGVEELARHFMIMYGPSSEREPVLLHSLYRGTVTIVVVHEERVVKEILEDLARLASRLGRPPEPFYAARYARYYGGVCCHRRQPGGYVVTLGRCPDGFEQVEC